MPPWTQDYLATGKAKLIFKNIAFIGQESKSAAEAAVCASDQGKFWEYHNKLFEEQNGENKGAFKVENLKLFRPGDRPEPGRFQHLPRRREAHG